MDLYVKIIVLLGAIMILVYCQALLDALLDVHRTGPFYGRTISGAFKILTGALLFWLMTLKV